MYEGCLKLLVNRKKTLCLHITNFGSTVGPHTAYWTNLIG